ncbi:MAG: arylsulfatase A-like enzyme, partial [Verrucomicrobiales bacterium]
DEPQSVLDLYGATPGDGSYASNCLLARRLAERGTRFIQLYHRGWDHHGGLQKYMGICSGLTDRPTWALLTDLKQRGMLDDTLVVWGGEFGRTPMFQGKDGAGRDHHIKGFSMWMAGGGIKPGISHGATDELGYNAVDQVVHVRDLHATMLHLLGIDHTRFSVQFQGLDSKLTGVEESHVVRDILA